VPVEIEYHWHNVYVIKRPGVDNFLKKMGELYEIVVFTASLSKVCGMTIQVDLNSSQCYSTLIQFWISLTFIASCRTDFSEKVVTTTKGTMLKYAFLIDIIVNY
jgi:hypothetical protein